jgi:hypothetical protein
VAILAATSNVFRPVRFVLDQARGLAIPAPEELATVRNAEDRAAVYPQPMISRGQDMTLSVVIQTLVRMNGDGFILLVRVQVPINACPVVQVEMVTVVAQPKPV